MLKGTWMKAGRTLQDWTDISAHNISERLGYPTQKPVTDAPNHRSISNPAM